MGKGSPGLSGQPKKAHGRPTKFTDATRARLLDAISRGATIRLACAAAGIGSSTLDDWRAKSKVEGDAGGPYSDLFAAITEAEGVALVRWLAIIEAAAPQQWQAAAWLAERKYPGEYGRRSLEITGKEGGPVTFVVDWGKPKQGGEGE